GGGPFSTSARRSSPPGGPERRSVRRMPARRFMRGKLRKPAIDCAASGECAGVGAVAGEFFATGRLRMARQYRRISADCHLDMLWLPPDLFTSNSSSKLRDMMPYVAENSDGVKRWPDNAGAEYGLWGGVGATGPPHVAGQQLRADKLAEAGHSQD